MIILFRCHCDHHIYANHSGGEELRDSSFTEYGRLNKYPELPTVTHMPHLKEKTRYFLGTVDQPFKQYGFVVLVLLSAIDIQNF